MEIDRIDITAQLYALQDKAYADFQSKLLPTIQRETVIGVRTPDLRKMAKQICKTPAAQEFLHNLPHRYFDENQPHDKGTLRFNELHREMTDCSQKMLSQTLKRLEQIGLISRQVYPEVPPRVEYSLTDRGQSLPTGRECQKRHRYYSWW